MSSRRFSRLLSRLQCGAVAADSGAFSGVNSPDVIMTVIAIDSTKTAVNNAHSEVISAFIIVQGQYDERKDHVH